MKNREKCFKILLFECILVFLSLFSSLNSVNAEIPEHTEAFYVNDFANVIYDDSERYVLKNSTALADETKAQVVVTTVNSLDDTPLEEYSLSMFRQWGIGDAKKNNGVLILLAPNERKVRVEVGPGLEGRLNDSKVGRFIDEYAVPCFKQDDWDNGICALYSAIMSEVYSEYGIEMPEDISDKVSAYNETRENSHMGTIIAIIIVAVFVLFGGVLLRRKRLPISDDENDNWWNNDGGFGGGGSFGGFGDGGSFGGGGGFGGSSNGGGASRGF